MTVTNKKKAPEGHPSIRKEDFKSKSQTKDQRQSARNNKPLFRNYDYTQEEPNETSPGGGLHSGTKQKYKSVKQFIDKKREQNTRREQNKKAENRFLVFLNGSYA